MARAAKRRAMVFIDGSTLRDTLRKNYRGLPRWPETLIHYEKLGRFLVGQDGEFVRVNYYTGKPVYYIPKRNPVTGETEFAIGHIVLKDDELHTVKRNQEQFAALQDHIDRCRFTTMTPGRYTAHREERSLDRTCEWVRRLVDAAQQGPDDSPNAAQRSELVEQVERANEKLQRANTDLNEARGELASVIPQLKKISAVPSEAMSGYSSSMSHLRGEFVKYGEKGVDTRLAVEMLDLCMEDAYDDAILVAADEDYVPLAEAVMRTGRRVIQAFIEYPGNKDYGKALWSVCDARRVITRAQLLEFLVDEGATSLEPTADRCPACREPINPEARKCCHCGENLKEEQPAPAAPAVN